MNRLIAISVLGLTAMPCLALTGNEWLEMTGRNKYAATTYLMGVVDGIGVEGAYAGKPSLCLQDGPNLLQYYDVTVNYLRAKPEQRHEEVAVLMFFAWQEAWPCPAKPQPPQSSPLPR